MKRGGRWSRGGGGAVRAPPPAVPPQLARQVSADGGDPGHSIAASEQKRAYAAGGDAFATTLNEIRQCGDVDPLAPDRVDRTSCDPGLPARGRFERPTHQPSRNRGGRQAEARDQRRTSRHPGLLRRRFESLFETLAEGRGSPLRTLPCGGQLGRGRDRRLLLGVATAQPQPAAVQEVREHLVGAVFWLVHGDIHLAAAPRRARSCMTFTAPTVEFISAATSLSEYP